MDTVNALTTALALGAAAALNDAGAPAVADGYNAIKAWIARQLPTVLPSLELLERAPESGTKQAVVAEDLERAQALAHPELVAQAEMLLALIELRAPTLGEAIGVSLQDIRGASLRITDVRAAGCGVVAERVSVDGAIDISGIHTGRGGTGDPKPQRQQGRPALLP
jgi:hypothetical protein